MFDLEVMQKVIAVIGLYFGLSWGFVTTVRGLRGLDIPSGNFVLAALGWTMFIACMWIF